MSSQSQQTREQFDWKLWKDNFCRNLDNWSYITGEDQLETMREKLLAQARQQWVKGVRGEIEKKRAGQFEWDGMYTMACDDILALPSLSLTEPKGEHE